MHVVASTFGSPGWPAMLPHARALADVLQSELTVLHTNAGKNGAHANLADSPEAASIIDTVRAADPGAAVQVMPGSAQDEPIVTGIARATGATVVAMHTQPGGPVQQAVTGGTATKLLDGADVPVLLGSSALEPPRLPYRLLIAVDDSAHAERAIQAVAGLLPSSRIPVGLITTYFDVLGDGDMEDEKNTRRERLAALAEGLPVGVEPELMVEAASGLETIQGQLLVAAERWGASVIVVAHQPRGRIQQALTGSTSLALLRRSPAPLLFAPELRRPPSPKSVGRSEVDLQGWRSATLRGLARRRPGSELGV